MNCFVEEQLGRSNSWQGFGIIRHMFQIGNKVAVFFPRDQIIRHPEIDVWRVIATIADQIVATVMSSADAGMTVVFLKNPLATVEYFPMQTVQTDAVIKPAIVAVHHMSEKVGFVFRFSPGPTCPGGSGIWALADRVRIRLVIRHQTMFKQIFMAPNNTR